MNLILLLAALIACPLLCVAQDPMPQEVTFTATSDRTAQKYVVLLPENFDSSRQYDVLIALHGHGSDRWQYMKPTRDETRATLDAAKKYNMIYLSPDYRGTTSWMGPQAEADLTQIIGAVKAQYKVRKIILTGGSMGGTSTLIYATLHPDLIDGIASMNGTANLLEYEGFQIPGYVPYQDAVGASYGGTKQQIPGEYKLRSPEYWPERLTMPVAITASGKDKTVPPDSVLRLAHILQKLNRRVLLIYREDAGHSTNYADATAALDFAIEEARK